MGLPQALAGKQVGNEPDGVTIGTLRRPTDRKLDALAGVFRYSQQVLSAEELKNER